MSLKIAGLSNLFRKKRTPVVGLTLSGGGLRGVGHLGVLKALQEHNIKPSILSGTSAGALVAAFYAAGLSPDEMLGIVLKTRFFSRSSFRFSRSGIFDQGFIEKLVLEYIPGNDFSALKLPLYVAATELSEGVTEYFYEGPLDKALLASMSIPLVFSPVKINGKIYMDGGIMNNLPIEPIRESCDLLIGVHVNALVKHDVENFSAVKLLDRVVHLALCQPVYEKQKQCDLFIDPPAMTRFSMFSKKEAQQLFDYTYDFTMQQLATKAKDLMLVK
jgi:NTE family protein